MMPESQKRQLLQRLHQLEYELHSGQQTLRLVQLTHTCVDASRALLQGQAQLHQQLQSQHEDVVRQLSHLS